MYIDTHIHFYDIAEKLNFEKKALLDFFKNIFFLTSDHSKAEFEYTYNFCTEKNLSCYHSFGIHPQKPFFSELNFLESLLKQKKIQAIGEIGFDLYDSINKSTFKQQQEVWHAQIELALYYNLPIVLHLRKATHLIFAEAKKLKKVKAIIFHSWPGNETEANSLLKLGLNAYFSIGKALLRGKKNTLQMGKNFPISRLLTETDAPYMTLKGEYFSLPTDIVQVTQALSTLRTQNLDSLLNQIKENFFEIFPTRYATF